MIGFARERLTARRAEEPRVANGIVFNGPLFELASESDAGTHPTPDDAM